MDVRRKIPTSNITFRLMENIYANMGFRPCGTVSLKDGFSLGPSRWDIFCGKKLGKLDHKKPQVLGGGIPADTSPSTHRPAFRRDAEFGDHFSHDLSLNARRAHMSIRRRRIRSHAWRTTQKQPHFLNTNHD